MHRFIYSPLYDRRRVVKGSKKLADVDTKRLEESGVARMRIEREWCDRRGTRGREGGAETRVTHHRGNKRGKTLSKSIRRSGGGGDGGGRVRRSEKDVPRQPWVDDFYDFLGSHNKVRQRVSAQWLSSAIARYPPSFVRTFPFPARGSPVAEHFRGHCLCASSRKARPPSPAR